MQHYNTKIKSEIDKRIHRAEKSEGNFYQVVKEIIESAELRAIDKAVMHYILSKPDDWIIRPKDIINHMYEGKDAIYAALKRLEEKGYLEQKQLRSKGGKFEQSIYIAYELPGIKEQEESPGTEPFPPYPGKPYTDKPYTDKPDITNNDSLTNNDLTNNENPPISPHESQKQENSDNQEKREGGAIQYIKNNFSGEVQGMLMSIKSKYPDYINLELIKGFKTAYEKKKHLDRTPQVLNMILIDTVHYMENGNKVNSYHGFLCHKIENPYQEQKKEEQKEQPKHDDLPKCMRDETSYPRKNLKLDFSKRKNLI